MYTFKNELHTFRNDTILVVSKTKLKLKKKDYKKDYDKDYSKTMLGL
jgi:hypothetical protein